MGKSRRWPWLALIVAVGATGTLVPLPWLVVREGEQTRYALPGPAGTGFVLQWTHSVEKEGWRERFQVQPDGSLMLVETRFKTFGAGVPDRVGTDTRLVDGWVVMSGIERPVDPLNVQAAAAENYRLGYHRWTLVLSAPGTAPVLTFTTRDAPLLTVLPALARALEKSSFR